MGLKRGCLGINTGPGTPETANGALDLRLHHDGAVLADPGRRLVGQAEAFKAVIRGVIELTAAGCVALGS